MKKFISILLCVALLCSLVVVAAHADNGPQMQVADATALIGSTIEVDLNVANNPGIASIGLDITDDDGLGVTFVLSDNTSDTLGMTAAEAYEAVPATPFWSAATNNTNATIATLSITIPDDAAPGVYTFTVDARDSANQTFQEIDIATTTFTVTVYDKLITGVNVAIDAGLAIAFHVDAADPDATSITAVNVAKGEFTTVTEYFEDEDNGGYIYYINVNPWDMDAEYVVDFTDNFAIEGDELNMSAITEAQEANSIGILSYCEDLLANDPSDELVQLIADMLNFGIEAQIYKNGSATLELPATLEASDGEWVADEMSFGEYCSGNYPAQNIRKSGTTTNQKNAQKRFKFSSAEIKFGAKFVVDFTFVNNGTATSYANGRVVVDGETNVLLPGSNDNEGVFSYAFRPDQYAGMDFILYTGGSTVNNNNKAYTNTYGPSHYAAYIYDGLDEEAEDYQARLDLLDILEAFYNYGVSVENYVGTLE